MLYSVFVQHQHTTLKQVAFCLCFWWSRSRFVSRFFFMAKFFMFLVFNSKQNQGESKQCCLFKYAVSFFFRQKHNRVRIEVFVCINIIIRISRVYFSNTAVWCKIKTMQNCVSMGVTRWLFRWKEFKELIGGHGILIKITIKSIYM